MGQHDPGLGRRTLWDGYLRWLSQPGVFNGTIFGLNSDGTGFILLHGLTGGVDPFNPIAALIQGMDGAFYGTTTEGGACGGGTAFWLQTSKTLSIAKAGTNTGTVTSDPDGICCGATCLATHDTGTLVTLSATPDPGLTLSGWSGNPDCADGIVTTDADKTYKVNFTLLLELTRAWSFLQPRPVRRGSVSLRAPSSPRTRGQESPPSSVLRFVRSNEGGGTLLKAVNTGSIKSGSSKKITSSVTLPSVNASDYSVIAIVDATNALKETNEANNVIPFGPLPVECPVSGEHLRSWVVNVPSKP